MSLHMYTLIGGLVPGYSGESGGFWLVDIVLLPMGMEFPSVPSVLPPTLPLGYPH